MSTTDHRGQRKQTATREHLQQGKGEVERAYLPAKRPIILHQVLQHGIDGGNIMTSTHRILIEYDKICFHQHPGTSSSASEALVKGHVIVIIRVRLVMARASLDGLLGEHEAVVGSTTAV